MTLRDIFVILAFILIMSYSVIGANNMQQNKNSISEIIQLILGGTIFVLAIAIIVLGVV